ncbi:unnamed protein product [Mytilus coruscus]|uniref:HECT-type E3 ubiquitin transferase n=1 Tax=Mytilus coruscus TaxID=42192 RepID=A0A6J8DJN6_MYTCO|nr:unnamed protein product [Mytilus coruscus]
MGLIAFFKILKKERIDEHMIESVSDSELSRLGLQTIGDRHRFRKRVRENMSNTPSAENGPPSVGSSAAVFTPTSAMRSNISEIRNRLFQPYDMRSRKRKGQAHPGRGRTWTANFVCLSNVDACTVPSVQEKEILKCAGLGLKKIVLLCDDNEESVVQKIMSAEETEDGDVQGFPKLKLAGGFELLKASQNCRTLSVLKCNWSVKEMKTVISAQTRVYIRPIQNNLSIVPEKSESGKKMVTRSETCQYCKQDFDVRALRAHVESCSQSSEETMYSNAENPDNMGLIVTVNEPTEITVPTEITIPTEITVTYTDFPDLDFMDVIPVETIDDIHLQNIENSVGIQDIIKNCIEYCREKNIQDPVEIVKKMQLEIVTGRPLEISNISEELTGQTTFISVNRENIIETGFEEIESLGVSELRNTLEVSFYGEMAVDAGGPRKEFFRLMLQEIKKKYFDNGFRDLRANVYVSIGKLFALSILQNGKVPQFMDTETLDKIFGDEPLNLEENGCICSLREGLDTLGIVEAVRNLPTLRHIFSNNSPRLTVKKLIQLLKPEFSERGSNRLSLEKNVYSSFMRYIREVSAGRRGALNLESILEFVTGNDQEPLLGFEIEPSIIFTECIESFLPMANTCICRMTLPRGTQFVTLPEDLSLFEIYDLSFSNNYYGLK